MLTRKDLHKVEMDLVWDLEQNTLTRDKIINSFTDLMSGVEK
jgi:hypothetical protein